MKKTFKLLASFLTCILLITGCGGSDSSNENQTTECSGDMTLEDLNNMLNDKTSMNMNYANTVAIVPFNHVNGPREEWKFYALINFVFKPIGEDYIKYQVTYLFCTCRSAEVNYWSTAYIELSLPESGEEDDIELRKLSFDKDGTGHYTAGFWGDSNPILDGTQTSIIATYEKTPKDPEDLSKGYYPSIKEDYIPLLIGMKKSELDQYNFMDDLELAGVMSDELFTAFSGASVSTNNILRILHAVFKYHADTYV